MGKIFLKYYFRNDFLKLFMYYYYVYLKENRYGLVKNMILFLFYYDMFNF